MNTIPPCIEYAKINGPVDEDEMAWALNLAKFLKSQGFPKEKAAIQTAWTKLRATLNALAAAAMVGSLTKPPSPRCARRVGWSWRKRARSFA